MKRQSAGLDRWHSSLYRLPSSAPPAPPLPEASPPPASLSSRRTGCSDAERRQLTVLFCDLVGSTALAHQLDPEDLRAVVRAYQDTCARYIARFDGHIAQYLGDGLLVYFGYPQAHEDDAQRAVRTGLGMLDAMGTLNTRLEQDKGVRLAVRVGIHTGLVVVGDDGERGPPRAVGPGRDAQPRGPAAKPCRARYGGDQRDDATGWCRAILRCDDLGIHSLKGVETPLRVYRVLGESAAQSRLDVAGATGLTPLVGREHEVGLLRERWAQSQDGLGQVVLLSGEAGIGKSRLVRVLTEHVADEGVRTADAALFPVSYQQRPLSRHRAPPAAPAVAPR